MICRADIPIRVLFMRRKMDEVLASQKKMLERQGGGDDSIADEQIAALFRKQLADFEEWLARQPNFEVIEVDYNRMLEQPDELVGEINNLSRRHARRRIDVPSSRADALSQSRIARRMQAVARSAGRTLGQLESIRRACIGDATIPASLR